MTDIAEENGKECYDTKFW